MLNMKRDRKTAAQPKQDLTFSKPRKDPESDFYLFNFNYSNLCSFLHVLCTNFAFFPPIFPLCGENESKWEAAVWRHPCFENQTTNPFLLHPYCIPSFQSDTLHFESSRRSHFVWTPLLLHKKIETSFCRAPDHGKTVVLRLTCFRNESTYFIDVCR